MAWNQESPFIGGGGGGGGWTDDGAIVRLTTVGDTVAIGAATMAGAEKIRIVGAARIEGDLSVPGVGANSIKIGAGALAGASFSIALGETANAGGARSTAIGGGALAAAADAVALGHQASAPFGSSIALGRAATTTAVNQLRTGNASFPITDVSIINGGAGQIISSPRTLTESHTLAAAVNSDTTIQIPAGALVLFVSARVTTTITGPVNWRYGLTTGDATPDRYGNSLALAAGTTNRGFDRSSLDGSNTGTVRAHLNASAIRLSAQDGVTAFTAGVVRITVVFIEITPPTS